MLPHMKEELISHEFADLSQLITKASLVERFILEKQQDRSNWEIVPMEDYDVSEDTSDYHSD